MTWRRWLMRDRLHRGPRHVPEDVDRENARQLTPEEFAREIRPHGSLELSEPSEVTLRYIRDHGED